VNRYPEGDHTIDPALAEERERAADLGGVAVDVGNEAQTPFDKVARLRNTVERRVPSLDALEIRHLECLLI
jgi:hypothetical protein